LGCQKPKISQGVFYLAALKILEGFVGRKAMFLKISELAFRDRDALLV